MCAFKFVSCLAECSASLVLFGQQMQKIPLIEVQFAFFCSSSAVAMPTFTHSPRTVQYQYAGKMEAKLLVHVFSFILSLHNCKLLHWPESFIARIITGSIRIPAQMLMYPGKHTLFEHCTTVL